METVLARHLAKAGFQTRGDLSDLLEVLKVHCDATEYTGYQKAIAVVDGQIDQLLNKIFSAYPDVKQDLRKQIEKYGNAI